MNELKEVYKNIAINRSDDSSRMAAYSLLSFAAETCQEDVNSLIATLERLLPTFKSLAEDVSNIQYVYWRAFVRDIEKEIKVLKVYKEMHKEQ